MGKKLLYCGLDLLIVGAFGWQLWEHLDRLIRAQYTMQTIWTEWRLLLTILIIVIILAVVTGDFISRIRRIILDRDINQENKK